MEKGDNTKQTPKVSKRELNSMIGTVFVRYLSEQGGNEYGKRVGEELLWEEQSSSQPKSVMFVW